MAFTNNNIHKYTIVWRKTQRTLLIIEERITTQFSNPASSSQHQSPLHLMKGKITQQHKVPSQRQTINTSLQITKFQPPDLSDEGSIYRCLQGCESSLGFLLVSFHLLFLIPLGDFLDLLLILGRIQRGKCHRRSFQKIL